jgi:hypothetical protein
MCDFKSNFKLVPSPILVAVSLFNLVVIRYRELGTTNCYDCVPGCCTYGRAAEARQTSGGYCLYNRSEEVAAKTWHEDDGYCLYNCSIDVFS